MVAAELVVLAELVAGWCPPVPPVLVAPSPEPQAARRAATAAKQAEAIEVVSFIVILSWWGGCPRPGITGGVDKREDTDAHECIQ